ncbi:hypothetical protein PACTADRAFT_50959 [Pachysolen tannophilus NRRL Y-2460]|uniref:Glycerophosphocholine acyltransferase 1 n=1 Tax=Pachysolen tannophilus NRRL Y-2460 TaxID=669874 RepID=A0A1E4TQS5_PACTA|nr:hypothetical protein PACTADRAFT_50959 [Pachysolen tannophilus NRRL Y-2460]
MDKFDSGLCDMSLNEKNLGSVLYEAARGDGADGVGGMKGGSTAACSGGSNNSNNNNNTNSGSNTNNVSANVSVSLSSSNSIKEAESDLESTNSGSGISSSSYKLSRSYSVSSFSRLADNVSFFELLDPSQAELTLKKTYDKVKSSSRNISNFTKKQKEKIFQSTQDLEIDKLKSNILKRLDSLNTKVSETMVASKTEKLFYAIALYNVFLTGIIIAKYPTYFHIYYSTLFCVLMPIRYLTYWKRGYGYFLADLCYYVNLLVMLFLWCFPNSKHLFVVCFAFTFGTLSWAVVTWRNSLVLHSIEKITSSFIHITPPTVMYVMIHQLPQEYREERFPGAASVRNWNFVSGILWTSLYYLLWQSIYHYFITIKRADKIKAGRVTSFSWLRKSNAKTPLGKFVNSLPEPLSIAAFTLIQFGYQLLTMCLCPIWFKYKRLATIFLTFIFLCASYNGATYYVDIFGKKFEKEVTKLQLEIAELQASSNGGHENGNGHFNGHLNGNLNGNLNDHTNDHSNSDRRNSNGSFTINTITNNIPVPEEAICEHEVLEIKKKN